MDRSHKAQRAFDLAEELARIGELKTSTQRKIVGQLENAGRDSVRSRKLLETLEQTQAVNVAELRRRQRERAELQTTPASSGKVKDARQAQGNDHGARAARAKLK